MTDKIQMWIAWKMPRWLVKWCTVRLLAHATAGEWDDQLVPDLTGIEALDRWEK